MNEDSKKNVDIVETNMREMLSAMQEDGITSGQMLCGVLPIICDLIAISDAGDLPKTFISAVEEGIMTSTQKYMKIKAKHGGLH